MTRRILLAASAFLVIAVAVVQLRAWGVGLPHQPPPDRLVLHGPAHWVPFSADIVETRPVAGPTQRGRFYRDSHGSMRHEFYGPDGTRLTTIHNLQSRTQFVEGPGGAWASTPYNGRLTAGPRPTLGVREGRGGTETKIEGMQAYRIAGAPNFFTVKVPELNFFSVIEEGPDKTRRYVNIRLEEPDAALFAPPAGAVVRKATSHQDMVRAPVVKSPAAAEQ